MTLGNWLRLSLVVVVGVVLQISVLDQIVVLNAHPDLLVTLPVVAALLAGPERGAIVGFLAGLGADLLVNLPFGLSPLTFVVVGFVVGMLVSLPRGFSDQSTRIALTGLGAGFATLIYALIAALLSQPDMLGRPLVDALFTVTVGGFVLAPLALFSVGWAFSGSRRAVLGLSVPMGGSAAT